MSNDGQEEKDLMRERLLHDATSVELSALFMVQEAADIVRKAQNDQRGGQPTAAALVFADRLLKHAEALAMRLQGFTDRVDAVIAGSVTSPAPTRRRVADGPYARTLDEIATVREAILKIETGAVDDEVERDRAHFTEELSRWRESESVELHQLARMKGATPAIVALHVLAIRESLMRNALPQVRVEIEDQIVLAEWATWTGYAFHNFPGIAAGTHYEHEPLMRRLCESFVGMAESHPYPAVWHRDHPRNDHMHATRLWHDICEIVARHVGMEPCYGIPAETRGGRIEMPQVPAPSRLQLLPSDLKAFLRNYETVRYDLEGRSLGSTRWVEWKPQIRETAD